MEGKQAARRRLLGRRAAIDDLDAVAAELSRHVLAQPWAIAGGCVAAYVPVGSEPGSVGLLDQLRSRGVRILLPIVAGRELDWAAYDAALRPGPWELIEPAGTPLGIDALADADAVLVPAVAVDRRGTRLGRGAGFYDRALRHARPGAPLLALLHDGELLDDELPAESHDVPMTGAITPADGMVSLRSPGRSR